MNYSYFIRQDPPNAEGPRNERILPRYHSYWLFLTDFKKSVVRVKNDAHGMAFIQCFSSLLIPSHMLPYIHTMLCSVPLGTLFASPLCSI